MPRSRAALERQLRSDLAELVDGLEDLRAFVRSDAIELVLAWDRQSEEHDGPGKWDRRTDTYDRDPVYGAIRALNEAAPAAIAVRRAAVAIGMILGDERRRTQYGFLLAECPVCDVCKRPIRTAQPRVGKRHRRCYDQERRADD